MADPVPTPDGGGTATQFIATLRRENAKLRDRNRDLKAKNEELEKQVKGGALPEGAVILKPDEAKQWEAFKALKLEPSKVSEALTERDTLKQDLAQRDRDALVRDAAEAVGFNPKVLADQVRLRELHLEMREVEREQDGEKKKVKVPHVRPAKDDKAQLEPLDAYAERELAEYLPALKADAAERQQNRGTTATRQGPASGYPAQRAQGGAKLTAPSAKDVAERKQAEIDYSL